MSAAPTSDRNTSHMTKNGRNGKDLRDVLRPEAGPVDVERDFDPRATPLDPGKGRSDAEAAIAKLEPKLDSLQEMLYANSVEKIPGTGSVLLVLQAMDAGGKDGTVKHVGGLFHPQGIRIKNFKVPTPEELQHDFLWRVGMAMPQPGEIVIFNRSQYEDVLVGRVDKLAPVDEIEGRYQKINDFERAAADAGTRIIKCFLNISKDEQKQRFAERLDSPEKYWKYNPNDLDTRSKWLDYLVAFGLVLDRCNTDYAPWYVIPANNKWYRDWAITELLYETMGDIGLTYPPADFDVTAERARVAAL